MLEGVGEGPLSRLHVGWHDPLVAVVRDLRLSEAERELIRLGRAAVWLAETFVLEDAGG